jgi:hypothetical protein
MFRRVLFEALPHAGVVMVPERVACSASKLASIGLISILSIKGEF